MKHFLFLWGLVIVHSLASANSLKDLPVTVDDAPRAAMGSVWIGGLPAVPAFHPYDISGKSHLVPVALRLPTTHALHLLPEEAKEAIREKGRPQKDILIFATIQNRPWPASVLQFKAHYVLQPAALRYFRDSAGDPTLLDLETPFQDFNTSIQVRVFGEGLRIDHQQRWASGGVHVHDASTNVAISPSNLTLQGLKEEAVQVLWSVMDYPAGNLTIATLHALVRQQEFEDLLMEVLLELTFGTTLRELGCRISQVPAFSSISSAFAPFWGDREEPEGGEEPLFPREEKASTSGEASGPTVPSLVADPALVPADLSPGGFGLPSPPAEGTAEEALLSIPAPGSVSPPPSSPTPELSTEERARVRIENLRRIQARMGIHPT